MDINLVKNVINGVNLVKIGHFFGEHGQNCAILAVKNDVIGQKLGKLVKNFSLKFLKKYLSQVHEYEFAQKCH